METKKYSPEERKFIIENASKGREWLAEQLGRPSNSVRAFLKNNKITTGKDGRFAPGSTPWNKGEKGIRLSPSSEFKKGNLPHNTKFDGHISIRRDKTGIAYKYIRISQGNYQLLHRVVWINANGPIHKAYIVTFKDGNSLNCDLSNLILLSKKENAIRNQNREKAAESMRKAYSEGRVKNGFTELSDKFIVHMLAPRNPDLKAELTNHPDLIDLKRKSIQLKREIKKHETLK